MLWKDGSLTEQFKIVNDTAADTLFIGTHDDNGITINSDGSIFGPLTYGGDGYGEDFVVRKRADGSSFNYQEKFQVDGSTKFFMVLDGSSDLLSFDAGSVESETVQKKGFYLTQGGTFVKTDSTGTNTIQMTSLNSVANNINFMDDGTSQFHILNSNSANTLVIAEHGGAGMTMDSTGAVTFSEAVAFDGSVTYSSPVTSDGGLVVDSSAGIYTGTGFVPDITMNDETYTLNSASVEWSDELGYFISSTDGENPDYSYSYDGITWTDVSDTNLTATAYRVKAVNGYFFLCADDENEIIYTNSTDASATWTFDITFDGGGGLRGIAFDGSNYQLITSNTGANHVHYKVGSTPGGAWSLVGIADDIPTGHVGADNAYSAVAGKFVLMTTIGNIYLGDYNQAKDDNITVPSTGYTNWHRLAVSDSGVGIAVCTQSATDGMMRSTGTLEDWVQVTWSGTSYSIVGLKWVSKLGCFYVVANDGTDSYLFNSVDGLTWTSQLSFAAASTGIICNDVCYSEKLKQLTFGYTSDIKSGYLDGVAPGTVTAVGLTTTVAGDLVVADTVTLSNATGNAIDVTSGGSINVGSTGAIDTDSGNITSASGDFVATAGNVTASSGTVTGGTVTDGAFSTTAGAITGVTSLAITGTAGNSSITMTGNNASEYDNVIEFYRDATPQFYITHDEGADTLAITENGGSGLTLSNTGAGTFTNGLTVANVTGISLLKVGPSGNEESSSIYIDANGEGGNGSLQFLEDGTLTAAFVYRSADDTLKLRNSGSVFVWMDISTSTGSMSVGTSSSQLTLNGDLIASKTLTSNVSAATDALLSTNGDITLTNGTVTSAGLKITGGTLASGRVLTSDADGVATWQSATAGASAFEAITVEGTTGNSTIRMTGDNASGYDNVIEFYRDATPQFYITHDEGADTLAITEDGGAGMTMSSTGAVTFSKAVTFSDTGDVIDVTSGGSINVGSTGTIDTASGNITSASGNLVASGGNVTAGGTVQGATVTDGNGFTATGGAITAVTDIAVESSTTANTTITMTNYGAAYDNVIAFNDQSNGNEFNITHDKGADTLAITENGGNGLLIDATGNIALNLTDRIGDPDTALHTSMKSGNATIDVHDTLSDVYGPSSVEWGEAAGFFVAAMQHASADRRYATSPDGINWTASDTLTSGERQITVLYLNNHFFLLPTSGDDHIYYNNTVDPTAWTQIDPGIGTSVSLVPDMAYNASTDTLILVCKQDSTYTSVAMIGSFSDLDEWTALAGSDTGTFPNNPTNGLRSIAYTTSGTLDTWVMVATSDRVWYSTDDGGLWTRVTSAGGSGNDWVDVVWGVTPEVFVAVSAAGSGNIMYSSNGISWTGVTVAAATGGFRHVKWIDSLDWFVATGNNGTAGYSYSSTDGITWTNMAYLDASDLTTYDAAYSPLLGRFVTVGREDANDSEEYVRYTDITNIIETTNLTTGNLVVTGNFRTTGDVISSNKLITRTLQIQDGAQRGYVLTSDAVGNATWGYGNWVAADHVLVVTTSALDAYTQGGTVYGATLTADSLGSLTIDGELMEIGDRVLVDSVGTGGAADEDNGIYTVTTVGDAGSAWVMTRAVDADDPDDLPFGRNVMVSAGTKAGRSYSFTTTGDLTMETTPLAFTQSTSQTDNITSWGLGAGAKISNGQYNTAVGHSACGVANVFNCTAVGNSALSQTTGNANTAVGSLALQNNTGGNSNTAVGRSAGLSITDGTSNVIVGALACDAGNVSDCTAVGYSALTANTAVEITAVGSNALLAQTDGLGNTAVGYNSGASITDGDFNTVVGHGACDAGNVSNCTAVGYNALTANTGDSNTAVGSNALAANTAAIANTAVGQDAGKLITDGSYNTLVGWSAGDAITSGQFCTAMGYSALGATTADYSTAFGASALRLCTSGAGNTAVGYESVRNVTTGTNNTALGYQAMKSLIDAEDTETPGSGNTTSNVVALGYQALENNTADGALAVGSDTLRSNTTGVNMAMGYQSGWGITTGSFNTLCGFESMTTIGTNPQASFGNTSLGYMTLNRNYGDANTAVGTNALLLNTSGDNNVAVGYNAGNTISGGANNTIVGYDADVDTGARAGCLILGSGATVAADNQIGLGPAGLEAGVTDAHTRATGSLPIYVDGTTFYAWLYPEKPVGDSMTVYDTSANTTLTVGNSASTNDSTITISSDTGERQFYMSGDSGSSTLLFKDVTATPFTIEHDCTADTFTIQSHTSGTVSGAVTDAYGIKITTSVAHGLVNGNTVTISGVGGTTELNGNSYTIVEDTSTTFLVEETFTNTFTSSGTWVRDSGMSIDQDTGTVTCDSMVTTPMYGLENALSAQTIGGTDTQSIDVGTCMGGLLTIEVGPSYRTFTVNADYCLSTSLVFLSITDTAESGFATAHVNSVSDGSFKFTTYGSGSVLEENLMFMIVNPQSTQAARTLWAA